MVKWKSKFKSGAASFYVVMISTLILVVVASSFAAAIVAEITRSSNDDLSQSAYDAALAGIEDAKLALASYQNCINSGKTATVPVNDGNVTCGEIIYWMENPDCDMVSRILGRISELEEGREVLIEETTTSTGESSNNMNQAYTCVTIQTELDDYRATLSAAESYRVIKVGLDSVSANDIKAVRISWYSNADGAPLNYTNLTNLSGSSRVTFQPLTSSKAAAPPTLKVQLIQTAANFSLEELNGVSSGNSTDRAAVFLVPTNDATVAATNKSGSTSGTESFIGVYDGEGDNVLTATQIAMTNDHAKDLPFATYCPDSSVSEYVCSALLNLPAPIGGARSDETFMFVVSLPYGQPDTDFSLEFICADGKQCKDVDVPVGESVSTENIATLSGMQIAVDSTGRANDLYRRVEMRIESVDSTLTYPFDAIRLIGNSDGEIVLNKDMTVTAEYGL